MSAEKDLQKAKHIFDDALDILPDQRAAFLASACADDANLRRHVESMLEEFDADSSVDVINPSVVNYRSFVRPPTASAPTMLLLSGRLADRFEIQMCIGQGGMGEVYRALDVALNEVVALKVLAPSRAMHGEAARRFRRELQLARRITHPNVCRLYDIGFHQTSENEVLFLTMELLNGETLTDALKTRGRFELDEARPIVEQIASGLAAAHRERIIHRDLKPSNIMLTPGRAVIMDFGLARTDSMSMEAPLTATGKVIGTPEYMAPEQLGGAGTISERTDLYAFGLVIYEMLTGLRPFQADTPLASALKRLTEDPPAPHTIVRGIDQRWESAILMCLEKDPARRPETAEHVIGLLDVAPQVRVSPIARDSAYPSNDNNPPAPLAQPRRRTWLWTSGIAVVALAVVAVAGWLRTSPASPRSVTRARITLSSNGFVSPIVSRDGTRLLYGEMGVTPRLWLRMMDQMEAHPVPGTEGGEWGTLSSDGQWIIFLKDPPHYKLAKIPVSGGSAITLSSDVAFLTTPSFAEDGSIIAGSTSGLVRVPPAGGRIETLTTINQKNSEIGHFEPAPLPGGRGVLFTVSTGSSLDSGRDAARIAVYDLKRRVYRVLPIRGTIPSYVPTGHLVYRRGGELFAVLFDLDSLNVAGPEKAVLEGLDTGLATGALPYSFTPSGLLVYRPEDGSEGSQERTTLAWMDRNGASHGLGEPTHQWQTVDPRFDLSVASLSPDGKRVVGDLLDLDRSIGKERVWVYEADRGILTPLTKGERDHHPIWSIDGRSVTFATHSGGRFGIYRIPVDSDGQAELLVATEPIIPYPSCWARDGKTLLYYQFEQGKGHIMLLPLTGAEGDGKPRRFHQEASSSETEPMVSPDGRWLAYTSDRSGKHEIYVSTFPVPGRIVQVSTQGGTQPKWSRDGRELFYIEPKPRRLMAAVISAGLSFQAGRPQSLFTIRNDDGPVTYDVAPDGKRFLVLVPLPHSSASSSQPAFVVVTNWFEELRRLAPPKKPLG